MVEGRLTSPVLGQAPLKKAVLVHQIACRSRMTFRSSSPRDGGEVPKGGGDVGTHYSRRVPASHSIRDSVLVTSHYEVVVCDVCGSADGVVLARIPTIDNVVDPLQQHCLAGLEFPDGGLCLVACRSCRIGYQSPRLTPAGIARFYEGFYDSAGPSSAYHRDAQSGVESARYRAIASTGRDAGVVLDVGAGRGYALAAFPTSSWERHAIDVSAEALDYLKSSLPDATVHVGMVTTAALPAESFDLVTMNSTLEHVRDLVDTLTEVRRILRPGGLLVFNVPNLAVLSLPLARITRQQWIGFTPEHLSYFTTQGLRQLGASIGFATTKHHTVAHREARPRWRHLIAQAPGVAAGIKRAALRQPGAAARLISAASVVVDWPCTSTALGRYCHRGENITGFWTA